MNYVVKVKKTTRDLTIESYGLTIVHRYSNLSEFFVASLTENQVKLLKQDSNVEYVLAEKLGEFRIDAVEVGEVKPMSTESNKFSFDGSSGYQLTNYQWHLNYLMSKTHTAAQSPTGVYSYTRTGEGVDIYVMDSGCAANHLDFRDLDTGLIVRVKAIPNWVSPAGDHLVDGQGHGTHVCGLAGGAYSGVAKRCQLYMARVFDNTGASVSSGEMIAAFNAIITHHQAKLGSRPSVLNLSLGDSPFSDYPYVYLNNSALPTDDYLDDMVDLCADAGITVVISAGNGFSSTAKVFHGRMISRFVRPARTEKVITVGALNSDSSIASYSNYGNNVDVFAPGTAVYSAYAADPVSIVGMSGTSMSAPIVSGLCALYLEENNAASPTKVRSEIIKNFSSEGQVKGLSTAHTADGVITTGTQLKFYDNNLMIVGDVTYPASELTADRAVFSPYKASFNNATMSLKYINSKIIRV